MVAEPQTPAHHDPFNAHHVLLVFVFGIEFLPHAVCLSVHVCIHVCMYVCIHT